jgi:predicted acylesterase/phospholipase RssA
MIKHLILSGAQLKGVCYVGVLKAIEELNILENIETIVGVSSGSLFGLAYCIGFTYESLRNLILGLDLESIKDFNSESIFKLFYNFGIDTGNKLEKLIKIILKKKTDNENITFKEFQEKYPKINFIIVGTNLTDCKTEYFSKDTTPDMYLWKALRISISFPFVFEKVDFNDKIFVDGGLLLNYPIEYFNPDKIENTLGISIISDNCNNKDLSTFDKYIIQIIYALSSKTEKYFSNKYNKNTINIYLKSKYESIDFSNETKLYLIEEGYNQFKKGIEKLDFKFKEKNSDKKDEDENIKKLVDEIIDKISQENKQVTLFENIIS